MICVFTKTERDNVERLPNMEPKIVSRMYTSFYSTQHVRFRVLKHTTHSSDKNGWLSVEPQIVSRLCNAMHACVFPLAQAIFDPSCKEKMQHIVNNNSIHILDRDRAREG